MVTILPALRHVREDLVSILDQPMVERICRDVGYRWREGPLDPFNTLHLFILQVLNQNTAMTHLPHLSGESFTASAYCQARQRLPLEVFRRVVDRFGRHLNLPGSDDPLWLGHRAFLMDGSGFSMPDTPELAAYFGYPAHQRPGCGFPVGHLLALMDAEAGLLHDVIVSPLRTHDLLHAARLHPRLSPGDVLVADRGFCSFAHLAVLLQAHLHAVFRINACQIVDFHPHRPCASEILGKGIPTSRWLRRLGKWDQLVEWRKPEQPPDWLRAEEYAKLPEWMPVREIKCRIRRPGCRVCKVKLVTTLLDPVLYPAAQIARLYGLRWQVEVDLRDLKTTLGMDVLKGHSVDVVSKEVQVFVLVYNLVRLAMLKAARRQQVAPDRISFIDALRWLQPPKPSRPLPDLVVNPRRPDRIEPRCLKRRPKPFPKMVRTREEYRKRLRKQPRAA